MTTSFARLWPAIALAVVPACDGCRKTDKPYTPFGVASALPSAAPSGSAAGADIDPSPDAADAGGRRFVTRPAQPAPSGAVRWALDGRQISAPPGRAFALGLVTDLDADGKNEIVAWTLAAKANAPAVAPGELWLYPPEAAPRKIVSLPGFVPSGPACTHAPALAQTGPRSVTLDVSANCTAMLLPRAPVRALMVVAPLSVRPALVTLRVAKPSLGDPFTLTVDSSDRDGDNRDDVHVVVKQLPSCRSGAPEASCNPDPDEREARADLVWLDRAAGTSRDSTEPSASLSRLAAWELGRSKRKKLAGGALGMVRNIRRLVSTLCAEAGVPRIVEEDGAAIRCAPLAVTADRLLVAEVQAALAVGDVQSAAGALDRDGWYVLPASEKRRNALAASIAQAAQVVEIANLQTPGVRAVPSQGRPRWSPLSFDSDGTLWVQTDSQLVSWTAAAGVAGQPDADAALARWPLDIVSPQGKRLQAVVPSCDRSDVQLLWSDPGPSAPAQPRLPLLAPRPGACGGKKAPNVPLVPIGWRDDALELVVAGQHLGPLTTSTPPSQRTWGSPRSPDGTWQVVPSSVGLLVLRQGKTELWRGAAIGDARRLSDCVVANGAATVACVENTTVRVARRP